jgi:hypothetical protein
MRSRVEQSGAHLGLRLKRAESRVEDLTGALACSGSGSTTVAAHERRRKGEGLARRRARNEKTEDTGPPGRTSGAQRRDLKWSRGCGPEQCDGRVPSGCRGGEEEQLARDGWTESNREGKRIRRGPP